MKAIPEQELPAPDSIIARSDGSHVALMFYFAAAEQDLGDIAEEQGFYCETLSMESDLPEGHPLVQEYDEGSDLAIQKWVPTVPPGWTLGEKLDTEDGPIAILIRRK